MALEAILNEIKSSGLIEIEALEKQNQEDLRALEAASQVEIQRIEFQTLKQEEARAIKEEKYLLQQSQLDAQKILESGLQELVHITLKQIMGEINSIRIRDSYAQLLKRLLDECLETIQPSLMETDTIILHIDPRDRQAFTFALEDVQFPNSYQVREDLNTAGGLILDSLQGRIKVSNTLETRMKKAEPFLKQQLFMLLKSSISNRDLDV
ncbi:MAG: hypothetical protein JEZ06_14715 [Anaerolineaceae bacterium]|nr:hypothetical protein [Anaerolineaceae bacterium]